MAFDLNSNGFASEANLHFFKLSSSSTSFMSRLTHPFSYQRHIVEYYYHHVNGLISVGHGQEQIVINPATGKFRTLPRVRTRRKIVNSFFGYDSVSDQYKVLCMTERVHGHLQEASSQHQVLTLGAKKESWKMINCSIPHRPCSNGVCINGVVYYVANTGAGMSHLSLMRFALRSDDNLDLFASLPEEIKTTSRYNCLLINYEGKVAIPNESTPYTVDVWVMNQEGGKHGWLKKTSLISIVELWKSSCHNIRLRGITHTGEFIYAPVRYADEFYVYYYNPDKNSFRKIKIQVSEVFHRKIAIIFPDYIESIRLL